MKGINFIFETLQTKSVVEQKTFLVTLLYRHFLNYEAFSRKII